MTINKAIEEFLIDQQIRGNSIHTVSYYKRCLKMFSDFLGDSDFLISDITIFHCKSYFMELQNRNINSITIQTYIRGLRALLTWCFENEYISVNIPAKFKLPKAKRKAIDILTDTEVKTLIDSFDKSSFVGLRNLCICSLMLDSGLRLNEVVTLLQSNLHIVEGYIIVTGKGNKERLVPLGLHSKKALQKYVNMIHFTGDKTPLFEKDNMTTLKATTIKQLFRKLKVSLNIPRLKPHLLRHTFATRYLENGGNIYELQLILGHTSLEMVKKYVHMTISKTIISFSNFSPLDNVYK